MKDGEVLLWLTEKERAAWVRAETAGDDDELAVALWAAMRSLAATRRALDDVVDALETRDDNGNPSDPWAIDRASRFVATMPRPR